MKKTKTPTKRKQVIKKDNFTLPPHKYISIVSTLSQAQGWGIKQTNIPDTWTVTKGEGQTALVIDTGWSDHIDLGDNCIKGISTISGVDNIDDEGHSTHVIGTICAQDNTIGMVGVAPMAKVIAVKALNDDGQGSYDQIAAALEYASTVKPSVVSMSLGAPSPDDRMYKAIKALYDMNIPVVCAAGNEGLGGVGYPAKYSETISVAAYDKNGNIADFSSKGDKIEFSGPGVDVYSTYLNNSYANMSGTCLTENVYIYTKIGPKKINKLQIGDLVYSFNEKEKQFTLNKVLKIWSNGIKPIRKIQTTRTNLECTNNHPILCLDKDKLIWKKAEQLQLNDYIVTNNSVLVKTSTIPEIDINDNWYVEVINPLSVTPKQIRNFNFNTNLTVSSIYDFCRKQYGLMVKKIKNIFTFFNLSKENLQFGSKGNIKINLPEMTPNFAYLLGYYLGDGWISKLREKNNSTNHGRGYILCFAQTNNNLINQKVLDIFKQIFHKELKLNKNGRWYYIYDTMICEIFEQLCCHKRACEKNIPLWLYQTSIELVLSFISGLIDSDGNKTGPNQNRSYSISTCSRNLAEGLVSLMDYYNIHRLNYTHRTHKNNAPNSIVDKICHEYCINFSIKPEEFIGIKQNTEYRKTNNMCKYDDTLSNLRFEKIKKIIVLSDQEVFDIEIENNHNFIANNIIVHNSMATPFITGIILLLLAKHAQQEKETGRNDCKTVEEIKQHLLKYTIDQGYVGKDDSWGYGIIDVKTMILAKNDEGLNLPVSPDIKYSFMTKTFRKVMYLITKNPKYKYQ